MPDHVTRLLVIRHGETAWNTVSRIQGHIDIPLNDKGRWQAERLAQALAGEEIHAIYSSDLQRARHTAEILAQGAGLEVRLDAQLRERHLGRFEGLTHDEIVTEWPDEGRRWRERDPAYGPQGGEVLTDFYARSVAALTRLALRHPGQQIVVVAHGGVLDCFYRAANGVDLAQPRSWKITNASINRLLFNGEGFTMVGWADSQHLDVPDQVLFDETTDGEVRELMARRA
jgi:probable phosphoglycerate mutase